MKAARLSCVILFSVALIPGTAKSAPPAWWSDPASPVVEEGGTIEENYAPANLGQLKNMALKAKIHLNANLVGEAGSAIDALVNGFEPRAGQGYTQQQIDAFIAENYAPINLGQLKAVAKPLYDRLHAAGFDTKASLIGRGFTNVWVSPHNWTGYYPWNPATAVADNYAPANIGQLKMVFSFDLAGFDTDGDGIPNWMELLNGTDPENADVNNNGIADGLDDFDGDGVSNSDEIAAGTNPFDPESVIGAPTVVADVNNETGLSVWTPLN